jgi:hypothetical protein
MDECMMSMLVSFLTSLSRKMPIATWEHYAYMMRMLTLRLSRMCVNGRWDWLAPRPSWLAGYDAIEVRLGATEADLVGILRLV